MKSFLTLIMIAVSVAAASAAEGAKAMDALKVEAASADIGEVPVASPVKAEEAKEEPDLKLLEKTKFSCKVVSVLEKDGDELTSSFKPEVPVEVSSRQWQEKKCMVIPTLSAEGKEKKMAFWGCFTPDMVADFSTAGLTTVDTRHNWVINIDLNSGEGRMSYDYQGIKWPGRITRLSGEAVLTGCVAETAR